MSSYVSSERFYEEYHGHRVSDLKVLYEALRGGTDNNNPSLLWTAGDSSLDNKYWFQDFRPATNEAYASVLRPPRCNADVTYWLNYHLDASRLKDENQRQTRQSSFAKKSSHMAAINTAVEATTINERTFRLRPQDVFLRDHIQSDDILVVSIGGNDVAMAPTPCTIISILTLVCCVPAACLEHSCSIPGTPLPIDDYCYGGCTSLLSCCCTCPPCFGYMRHLFGARVQKYIEALTSKTKPKKILVCMIYYPAEQNLPSWAGPALGALGYNSNPEKLQLMIRRAFVQATSNIQIPGSQVIPVPLFHVLDGSVSRDYIARVEPSATGGEKMAKFILEMSKEGSSSDERRTNRSGLSPSSATNPAFSYYGTTSPPPASSMTDR